MTDTIENYNEIAWRLHQEVEMVKFLIGQQSDAKNIERLRRVYVRSVFSFIEGITFQLKQIALERAVANRVTFSAAELALLNEEKYKLKDSGEADLTFEMLELQSNIKFAAKSFIKALDSTYTATYSDSGWGSLKSAKGIRNRLTHPKTPHSIEITDSDFITIEDAFEWYWEWFIKLLDETGFHSQVNGT
ncbi:hypothetical protein [uncultured Neptuniibacter sp.]|uniref:hypothetical protein n=1 Tax=uncultured Neptuniibacter sp. TaxID=502143 RepID=UPI00261C3A3B|nr:hypothetical protein [uncultured Neptuniibacter sp.]